MSVWLKMTSFESRTQDFLEEAAKRPFLIESGWSWRSWPWWPSPPPPASPRLSSTTATETSSPSPAARLPKLPQPSGRSSNPSRLSSPSSSSRDSSPSLLSDPSPSLPLDPSRSSSRSLSSPPSASQPRLPRAAVAAPRQWTTSRATATSGSLGEVSKFWLFILCSSRYLACRAISI